MGRHENTPAPRISRACISCGKMTTFVRDTPKHERFCNNCFKNLSYREIEKIAEKHVWGKK